MYCGDDVADREGALTRIAEPQYYEEQPLKSMTKQIQPQRYSY